MIRSFTIFLLLIISIYSSFSSEEKSCDSKEESIKTNGPFLNHAMASYDSVGFMLAINLGIPEYIYKNNEVTPLNISNEFGISLRSASAIMVTLCRLNVVLVSIDNEDSVDEISYNLTKEAKKYLGDPYASSYTSHFVETFYANFMSPDKLLEVMQNDEDNKGIMVEHLEETNEEETNNARHFMNHMNSQSYDCAVALPSVLGLDKTQEDVTLLDVGGGSGIFTIEAVKANPDYIRGIIFELKNIVPITQEYVDMAKLADKIQVKEGNFFRKKMFPDDVDIVLFSNILHDWPDETNLNLLQKAFDALKEGGKVVISEMLLDDDVKSSSSSATNMNLIMLTFTKGRQYRPKELFKRLKNIGFVNPTVHPLADDVSIVVAQKPEDEEY